MQAGIDEYLTITVLHSTCLINANFHENYVLVESHHILIVNALKP
ncbi:MAG: hypothetical protein ACI9CE_001236 [Flavobacterium sp.]|jgi:hypothetical protein